LSSLTIPRGPATARRSARPSIVSKRTRCAARSKRLASNSSLKEIFGATPRIRVTSRSNRRAEERWTSSCSNSRSEGLLRDTVRIHVRACGVIVTRIVFRQSARSDCPPPSVDRLRLCRKRDEERRGEPLPGSLKCRRYRGEQRHLGFHRRHE